ncbi:MAG: short chain dehydrogenase [Myxococcales bacterium]|nr:short chain dehydrogenase [Myxococcales bacterium]
MKQIALIGATGTIGRALAAHLEARGDEVIRLSRGSSPSIDLEDAPSVRAGLAALGRIDAVVCVAGRASFGAVPDLSDEALELGIRSKLRGQIDLVRWAPEHLRPGGAIVLTSGMLAHRPGPGTAPVSMVNAAIEAFARAAALDLSAHRVEVVCPPLIQETALAMGRSEIPAPPAADVAQTYARAIDGHTTGTTYFVPGFGPGRDA